MTTKSVLSIIGIFLFSIQSIALTREQVLSCASNDIVKLKATKTAREAISLFMALPSNIVWIFEDNSKNSLKLKKEINKLNTCEQLESFQIKKRDYELKKLAKNPSKADLDLIFMEPYILPTEIVESLFVKKTKELLLGFGFTTAANTIRGDHAELIFQSILSEFNLLTPEDNSLSYNLRIIENNYYSDDGSKKAALTADEIEAKLFSYMIPTLIENIKEVTGQN